MLCAFQELDHVGHVDLAEVTLWDVIVAATALLELYEVITADDESEEWINDLARLIDYLNVGDVHAERSE